MSNWRTYCAKPEPCVEFDTTGQRVAVRDSKLGEQSPVIYFEHPVWGQFRIDAEDGKYGLELLPAQPSLTASGVHEVCIYRTGPDQVIWRCSCPQHTVELSFTDAEQVAFIEGFKTDND
jgi:hypothetical protein